MLPFVQLPYRKGEELPKPQGLGPAVVALSLVLILLLQFGLIVWLYLHHGLL